MWSLFPRRYKRRTFYHNAADREPHITPRKWFTLLFVPLISRCGLSTLPLSVSLSLHCLSHYKTLFAFWRGGQIFLIHA